MGDLSACKHTLGNFDFDFERQQIPNILRRAVVILHGLEHNQETPMLR